MKILKFILIPLVGSVLVGRAWAQEADPAPVTLELTLAKVEQLALKGNPHIHAARARARAADKEVLPALFPADPSFMIDKTGESGDPLNFSSGMEMWMVEENLGFPGKGIVKADALGAEAKRLEAEAGATDREILLQARQAFWEFYFRSKVDGILQDAEKNWKHLSQVLQSKELSGQWLSLKTIKMQMESARAVNDLITNTQALRVSQLNLTHLFSLPHATSYALAGDEELPALALGEEEFVHRALHSNPQLESARREVEAKEAEGKLALLDHLPDFNLRLSGTRDPNGGFSDYGFRFGLSVPIFFPAKQTQRADAAGERTEAARYDLKGKQDEVIHMTEQAYVGAQSAWRLLQLYEQGGLLKQTERAWQATQLAYRNEEIQLPEFVDNYNTYLQTVTAYYQARTDYGKALAELEYQAGDLGGDDHEKP
ncbi:MAG TPA: TolC family protein [bacterium]|nr:TolC family protein [bacterium]